MIRTRAQAIGELLDLAAAGEWFGETDLSGLRLGQVETDRLRMALLAEAWPNFPSGEWSRTRADAAELIPEVTAHPTDEERQASRERGLALLAAQGRGPRRHANQPGNR